MPLKAAMPLLPAPRTLPAAVSTIGDWVAIETSLAIALPPTSSRRRPGPIFQPSGRCRSRYRPEFILGLAKGQAPRGGTTSQFRQADLQPPQPVPAAMHGGSQYAQDFKHHRRADQRRVARGIDR